MHLTESQHDALAELINIGHGRAAGALSQMTGYRIDLEAPSLQIMDLDRASGRLGGALRGPVVNVTQVFAGSIHGHAMLLLAQADALTLSKLLDDTLPTAALDAKSLEVITEAGNILLNACLGVFGNLLELQVSFSVPSVALDQLEHMFRTSRFREAKLEHAIIVQTRFRLRANAVTGHLLIVVGMTSLEKILDGLADWERRSGVVD